MRWSQEDIDYLIKNYSNTNIKCSEISNALKRSAKSVKHKAARCGLSRGPRPHNKPKDRFARRKWDRNYYGENKKAILARRRKRFRDLKIYLTEKLGGKCARCSENRLPTLTFHHTDKNKEGNVAQLITWGYKKKAIQEVEKCIILCANCHHIEHWTAMTKE